MTNFMRNLAITVLLAVTLVVLAFSFETYQEVVQAQIAAAKLQAELAALQRALDNNFDTPIAPMGTMVMIGTGFFVNNNGYLVTAAHVVKGSKQVQVKYKGKMYVATVVSVDYDDDSAILHIDVQNSFHFIINTHKTNRTDVAVMGFPEPDHLGWDLKLTRGVLFTHGRGQDQEIFAISCPGNSGGPVINENGEIEGILVAGYPEPTFNNTKLEECGIHDLARPLDGIIQQAKEHGVLLDIDEFNIIPRSLLFTLYQMYQEDGTVLIVSFPTDDQIKSEMK